MYFLTYEAFKRRFLKGDKEGEDSLAKRVGVEIMGGGVAGMMGMLFCLFTYLLLMFVQKKI